MSDDEGALNARPLAHHFQPVEPIAVHQIESQEGNLHPPVSQQGRRISQPGDMDRREFGARRPSGAGKLVPLKLIPTRDHNDIIRLSRRRSEWRLTGTEAFKRLHG